MGPWPTCRRRAQIDALLALRSTSLSLVQRLFADTIVSATTNGVLKVMDPAQSGTVKRADMQALADDIAGEQAALLRAR